MANNEYKTPQKPNASSNLFNDQFSQYLYKSKWTNPNIQKEFIALINSIVLSAKDAGAQNMMVNYMKKGLDILNVELQKVDLENKKTVKVDSEDVDTEVSNLKTESKKRRLKEGASKEDLKSMMERLKDSLVRKGFDKSKIESIIKFTFDIGDGKKDKKLLLDLFDKRISTLEEKITKKVQLNEEGEKEQKPTEPKKEQPKHKAPIKAKKADEISVEKQDDGKDTMPVVLNTFRTFFRNYILEDQMWVEEIGASLTNYVVNTINKYESNPDDQSVYNSKLNTLVSQFGKVYDLDDASEDSVNITNAKKELEKYAVTYKGWSNASFESFFRNIIIVSKSASVSNIQRLMLKKLNEIKIS